MSSHNIPVAILVRVSTSKQETQRQISELQTYAESKTYNVVEICRETVSGCADDSARKGLRRVEDLARSGKIKKVLVHEVSRLARKNSVAHRFVETLEDCGVSLYWHAQGIETLLPNGERNPAAGIMLALLAEMARSEVEVLRARINSGLAQARRNGVKLGRPKGSCLAPDAFLSRHRDITAVERGSVAPQCSQDCRQKPLNCSAGKESTSLSRCVRGAGRTAALLLCRQAAGIRRQGNRVVR
jgi:DNA invertase Pin-like site-specific DNA recombinase